jgi:citrate/tricarballylate utilization protein
MGGIAMLAGIAGLVYIKLASDRAPAYQLLLDIDYSFLVLLFVAAATGLVLLGARDSAAMPRLLAVHLGVIVSLFLILPYCKFVHGIYRGAALLRYAAERPGRKRTAAPATQSAGA